MLGLVILLVLFLTGIELSFCMAIIGFFGFAYLNSFSSACNLVVRDFFETFTNYGLTVSPLFMLMGQIASNSDIAKRLYLAAHRWVGHVPGGLAMTTVVGATVFKSMCGSTFATVATFSGIAIPEMDRYGYKELVRYCGISDTIGMLIPPSMYIIWNCRRAIGEGFLAG